MFLDHTAEGLENWIKKYSKVPDIKKGAPETITYKFKEKYEGGTLDGMRHGYGKYYYK